MIKDSVLESMEENEESCFQKFCKMFDFFGFITAMLTLITCGFTKFIQVSPLYVPENDSLSAFPKVNKNTIEFFTVIAIGIICNVIFNFGAYFLHKYIPKLIVKLNPFSATWTCIASLFLSCTITNILKANTGRPRPDMYAYCGTNANYRTCQDLKHRNNEFKSWPSGHTTAGISLSVSAVFFLQNVTTHRSLLYSVITSLFMLFGYSVGFSRITDYRHHTDDVLCGFVLGFITNYLIWSKSKEKIFYE